MTITTAPGGIEMEMHNGITIAITSEANRFGQRSIEAAPGGHLDIFAISVCTEKNGMSSIQ